MTDRGDGVIKPQVPWGSSRCLTGDVSHARHLAANYHNFLMVI